VSQYYFLIASLPLLAYDNREAMEPEEFLAMLGDHMAENDLHIVAAARIDAPLDDRSSGGARVAEHPTVARWNTFERGLRNALVKMRASKKGVEPSRYIRLDEAGHDGTEPQEIAEASREAVTHDSPLSGEDMLNRARWAFLEELQVGHFFDIDVVIVYYLKLQILARRRLFVRKEGEERFVQITDHIMNDYYQEQSE
jgi:hypothetical protein